jgi:hypothetical protein
MKSSRHVVSSDVPQPISPRQQERHVLSSAGTFTVRSEYRDTSEGIEGVWQIADGIGDYATASGHGAVAFGAAPIPGDGFLFTLTLTGSASNIG